MKNLFEYGMCGGCHFRDEQNRERFRRKEKLLENPCRYAIRFPEGDTCVYGTAAILISKKARCMALEETEENPKPRRKEKDKRTPFLYE